MGDIENANHRAINIEGINHEKQLSDESDNIQVINSEENIGNILEENISPFKIYEERYCNKCEDYRGCLGLIDSMTMMLQDSKAKSGYEGLDNMVKSLGGLTFSARFKIILDCSGLRNFIQNTNRYR